MLLFAAVQTVNKFALRREFESFLFVGNLSRTFLGVTCFLLYKEKAFDNDLKS